MKVHDVLLKNAQYIKYFDKCPSADLFELSTLIPQQYNESFMRIVPPKAHYTRCFWFTVKQFFEYEFSFVNKLITEFGIVLCGGCLARLISANENQSFDYYKRVNTLDGHDFDFFFIGEDIINLQNRMKQIIAFFYDMQKYCSVQDISVTYNGYTVNIKLKYRGRNLDLQFILRGYKHLSHVLHGFDLGSSCIGYDGSNVYVTTLGAYAYQYNLNIVDLNFRSTSYESRLIKYFTKLGFGVILPQMKLMTPPEIIRIKCNNKIEDCRFNVKEIEFPYIKIFVKSYSGDDVIHTICGNMILFNYNKNVKCDYGWKGCAIQYNSHALLKGNFHPIMIFQNGNWQIQIDNNIIDTYCKVIEVHVSKDASETALQSIEKSKKNHLEQFENNGFAFNIVNPTTQTYGIYNPVITDPKEWYGEFLQS